MSQREIDGRSSLDRYARRMKGVDLSWMDDGACSSPDVTPKDFWLPPEASRGGRRTAEVLRAIHEQEQRALAFCDRCPVAEKCLAYANKIRPSGGIWGGVRFRETNDRSGWRDRKPPS